MRHVHKYKLYNDKGEILFKSKKAESIEECFLEAVKNKVNLQGVVLENASFNGITLYNIDLSEAVFRNCGFDDSDIENCQLNNCLFVDSFIQHSRINNCNFNGGVLENLNRNEFNDNRFVKAQINHAESNEFNGNLIEWTEIRGVFNHNNIEPSKQLLPENRIKGAGEVDLKFVNAKYGYNNKFSDLTLFFKCNKSTFETSTFNCCSIERFEISDSKFSKNEFHRCEFNESSLDIRNSYFEDNEFKLGNAEQIMKELSSNNNKQINNKTFNDEKSADARKVEKIKEFAEPYSPGM